jgi:hypothetical protein
MVVMETERKQQEHFMRVREKGPVPSLDLQRWEVKDLDVT